MANLMRPLPATITTLRERGGRTLRGLALEAGIDAATLCRIEAGASNGRPGTLLAIAKALDVPIEAITYNSAAGVAA
jgi:transcriptional regulator with XRE-family HTH domain